MNKRQQVRNERTLQDLIKNVPGNDRCADCGARNPGWASWSLGIFLCLRCAALHRKLGTHISKVKSLSMDQWSVEQVEHMKRVGNTASNRIYNPRNAKPSIPIDVDEVDGVMERFIRQKYESKTLSNESSPSSRHHTGSTSSDDRPAALPPKPAKRFHFGLRSASSILPQSRNDKTSPPMSPTGLGGFGRDLSPPRNKPAKVFGADIGGSRDDNYKMKLTQLKEMGFPDEKKNLAILKGLNGNIDRAVEELVRLGEGSRRSSRTTTPAPRNGVNGIAIEKTRSLATNGKTAPFDGADTSKSLPPLPASSPVLQQPTGQAAPQTSQPPNSYNPFLQPQQSLDQSFQGLQVSQPTQQMQPPQQLFPNTTGGYGSQAHAHNPFLQTYTPPPMLTSFQQNQFTAPAPFPFQSQQAMPQPTGSDALNPFLRPSRSQVFNSTNPFENQAMASPPVQQSTQPFTYGPFSQVQQPQQSQEQTQPQPTLQTQYPQTSTFPPLTQSQQSNYNPFQQSAPSQQPQHFFQQPLVQSPQAEQSFQFRPQAAQPQQQPSLYQQPPSSSAYSTQSLQQQQQQPQQQLPPQQPYHQPTFPPIRYDKSSILALYNMPLPSTTSTLPTSTTSAAAASPHPTPKRSATMPVATLTGPTDASSLPGSHNPFVAAVAPQQQLQAPATNGFRHGSNESVDFAGFASGRHSPDAFAGLSARVSTPRLR